MFWVAGLNVNKDDMTKWQQHITNLLDKSIWGTAIVTITNSAYAIIFFDRRKNKAPKFMSNNFCGEGFINLNSNVIDFNELVLNNFQYKEFNNLDQASGEFSLLVHLKNKEFLIMNDFYSIRPIYYSKRQKKLLIASDIRALMANQEIIIEPDHRIILHYLHPKTAFSDTEYHSESTAYLGIHKLGIGQKINYTASEGKITKTYMSLNLNNNSSYNSYEEYIGKIEAIIKSNTVPLIKEKKGIFDVSGGIDSSTVLASALSSGCNNIHTSSMIFQNDSVHFADDKAIIDDFLGRYKNIKRYEVFVEDGLKYQEKFVSFLGPSCVANLGYALLTQKYGLSQGIDYHFTGEGADFHYLGSMFYFDKLIKNHEYKALNQLIHKYSKVLNKSVLNLYFRVFVSMLPIMNELFYKKMVLQENYNYKGLEVLLSKKGLSEFQNCNDLTSQQKMERKQLDYWVYKKHFDMLLPKSDYSEELSHFPIHIVQPYLNRNMIDISFSTPVEFFINDTAFNIYDDYAYSKKILRDLFTNIIPSSIREKKIKSTYNEMALIRLELNHKKIKKSLLNNNVSIFDFGYLNKDIVLQTLDRMNILSKLDSTSLGLDYRMLLNIYNIQEWLINIDRSKYDFLYESFKNYRNL